MNQPNTHPHQEIIIIKRKKVSHDGHHGGAWKIAYADFVTAMMAFFLVMWLINASNEETKAAVASYFNPVQLMDSTSNPKGIKDAQYGASSKDLPADSPKARSDARPSTDDEKTSEKADEKIKSELDDNIFRDPYAVLAEIAGGTGRAEGGDISELPIESEGTPRPGLAGGEAYRDPFEPEFWSKAKKEAIELKVVPVEAAADAPPVVETQLREIPVPEIKDAQTPVAETPISQPLEPEPLPDAKTAEEVIADDIQKTLAENPDVKNAPQIAVEAGDGTVTVNLTDGADYSMFELGSARPKREVIALVEKIAAILNSKPGSIEIAGHTDARPFKSDNYDNWRLSSARAQMAYYMLVRAGVSSDRFSAIIGHSSAKLRIGEDPLAPQNRRIEITLITPKVVTP